MKIRRIIEELDATIFHLPEDYDEDIPRACAGDLISDILVTSDKKRLLITGLTTPQVIKTASILDLAAVAIVRGKTPHPKTVDAARKRNLPLIGTEKTMFCVCALLSQAGMLGIDCE